MSALDDRLPPLVRLEALGVACTLPPEAILSTDWDHTLRPATDCLVRLGLDRAAVSLAASPPLFLDARWPARNLKLSGARCPFGGGLRLDLRLTDGGIFDLQAKAAEQLEQSLAAALSTEPLGLPGYDPFADPDLLGTLTRVGEVFQGTETAGESAVTPEQVGDLQVDATVRLTADFEEDGLFIPAGAEIAITVVTGNSLASLSGVDSLAGAVAALRLRAIHVTSDAVQVRADGAPVARLQRLSFTRGGGVEVHRMALEGTALKVASLEALARLVLGGVRWMSAGVSPSVAFRMPRSSESLVGELTRERIEAALDDAVRLALANAPDLGDGVSLAALFGVDPQPDGVVVA